MKLKPYPKYKPSGVQWLGDLPAHWEAKRLKYIANSVDRKVEADEENPVPYIGLENIESWTGRLLPLNPDMVPTGVANSFVSGKLLFGKLRPYLAKACIPDFNGLCSTELLVLGSNADADKRFLRYSLLSEGFINLVDSSTYGSKMPRANWDFIGSTILPLPSLAEQRAIAEFLDRETTKIDRLVEKQKTLLERLKEKRTALISYVVTKGLDPKVKMKPSCIPWLGDIPKHWVVKRLKFIFPRFASGVSVNAEQMPAEKNYPGVLKTSCVYGNLFNPSENKRVLEDELDRVACPVTRDSLIISRMNTPELVGSSGYVDKDYPFLFLPDRLWIARFQEHLYLYGKFAWYFTISHSIVKLTGALATGTSGSMKNLSQESYLNIPAAVPPFAEQQAIAAHLDRETGKIDALVSKVEQAIERLQEYRTALISKAVTGKIDVTRNVKAG